MRGRRVVILRNLIAAALILCTVVPAGAAGGKRSSRVRPGDRRTPETQGARILPDYRTVSLPNGLTLLVMEHHELPLVNFHLLVKTGSAADPAAREGLASMTADLLRQGTKSRSSTEFSEAVDFLGGTLEADADRDRSLVSGEFLSRDFRKGLDLMAEMVLTPGFRQEEIERSRKQRLAAIQQELDDPETIADKRFERFLFGTHPYARSVEGTLKSIPALTRDEIVGFYDAHYAPNNSILAIVGDITPEIAVAAARGAFGGWTRKPVPRTAYPPSPSIKGRHVLIVDKPDVNQSQIRIGTIGIRRSDPAYFPAQVMATILGGGFTSWLNQEIREKRGLSYGARCRFDTRLEPGPLTVSTFTKNETVGETIKVALDTLSRFRDGKFAADDLRKAQNFRAGQYPLNVETTDQLAAQVADLVFFGLGRDFVDRQIEHIRSVTLEQLRSVSPKLPVSDYVMVVVTNAAAVRPQLEGLGTIEVVKYDAPE